MSHDQTLHLRDRLETVLEQFEADVNLISENTTSEQAAQVRESADHLEEVLLEVKRYFVEVRNKLAEVSGIPPAKELAQLVIGASTEALSAIREVEYNLEELENKVKRQRRSTITRREIFYAELGAKEAIRKSHYILKRIAEEAEHLPDQI
ncbi:MAG: hypothetical protein ACFE89_10210 [Candidatus Hodarchaeota archaeon]